jgi:hypothetical protein
LKPKDCILEYGEYDNPLLSSCLVSSNQKYPIKDPSSKHLSKVFRFNPNLPPRSIRTCDALDPLAEKDIGSKKSD